MKVIKLKLQATVSISYAHVKALRSSKLCHVLKTKRRPRYLDYEMRQMLVRYRAAELGRSKLFESFSAGVKDSRHSPECNGRPIQGFKLRSDIF